MMRRVRHLRNIRKEEEKMCTEKRLFVKPAIQDSTLNIHHLVVLGVPVEKGSLFVIGFLFFSKGLKLPLFLIKSQ